MWIFGRASRDWAALFIPGFVVLALVRWIPPGDPAYLPLAFLSLSLIDSGHGYTTALRTHLDSAEFSSRRAYWLAPLLVFSTFFLWAWLRIPYLWSVVLYITIFHHLRQFYGIVRWYEKLNRRTDPASPFFSQALIAGPIVLYHFNPGQVRGLLQGFEMLAFPSRPLWTAGLALYACIVAAWLFYEARLWWHAKIREPNRTLAIGLPALLVAACFLGGQTQAEVVFPMLVAHGVAYFALLALSLRRLRRASHFRVALATVVGVSFTFGALEYLYEQNFLEFDYLTHGINALGAAVLAIYVTPSLCHYLFDAWLWKGNHRQAKLVFSPESNSPAS